MLLKATPVQWLSGLSSSFSHCRSDIPMAGSSIETLLELLIQHLRGGQTYPEGPLPPDCPGSLRFKAVRASLRLRSRIKKPKPTRRRDQFERGRPAYAARETRIRNAKGSE
jgi:hypothetical protein